MSGHRFGKHPPKSDYRTLRLKDYLGVELPPPHPSHDVLGQVLKNLDGDVKTLFPMDANDRLNNCTVAAMAHAVTVYNGLVKVRTVPAQQDVIRLYLHLTDGIDRGLSLLDVLGLWRRQAFAGEQILAYAKVDFRNHDHVKQAVTLFGGLFMGFHVQQDCVADFDAGRTWTPGPFGHDGHAVYVVGYDAQTVTVLTWGNTHKGTWAWWDDCVDEAYAIVPPQAKQPQFHPGLDLGQLQKDLTAVASP